MLKKLLLSICFIFLLSTGLDTISYAKTRDIDTTKDSRVLIYNDMLMLILNAQVEEVANQYYFKKLKQRVAVYPYDMNVVNVKRVNGFRGFDFLITIETKPSLGAHNPVGKDRFTFQISPDVPKMDGIQLIELKHIKSYSIPPHLRD
ncbi:DUF3888 domain-containing protein [Priestia megaterium]|uniref:DUF3888 domain-containing protein n=1 Tax=Priestia megaterium TaxID=1404 RepID=UPI0021D64E0B|nr:DUF3888 domain-containing protein [Priestia megaterium]MCU7766410.1 DUF3888 domain-containing protein [Priestia megaterium]